MEKVFASVRLSSPLPVAVARTSQSPFPLYAILRTTILETRDEIQRGSRKPHIERVGKT